MKKLYFLIFCVFAVNVAIAQPGCPSPFGKNKSGINRPNDNKFELGAGIGVTSLNGDNKSSKTLGIGYYLNFDYKLVQGLYIGLRGQMGTFKVGQTSVDKRSLESDYMGFGAGLLIHPFEMINKGYGNSIGKDLLDAFYVGADILSVSNKIKSINRGNPAGNYFHGPVDGTDGSGNPIFKDKVSALMLPSLNIGFAPALNKHRARDKNTTKNIIRIVLNAQFNFANNDELDGYTPLDANGQPDNSSKDSYYFYSLGLRYSF